MSLNNEYMKNNILALAVQGALLAMFALPMVAIAEGIADEETTALTHPTNSVEFGVTNVSRDSVKFGEYNGLNKSGVYGIANINLLGGNAYDDSDSVMRWQLKATDLGTTSREIGATINNQGQWNIGVNFDELRHNLSDSYQTPYQGSMGGNNFTLPAGFGTVADTTLATTNNFTAAKRATLHNVDINTTRENSSISAGYIFNPQWDVKFDFNHLNQKGAKLMAFGAAGILIGSNPTAPSGEVISILPNPTNYTTDTVNLALSWIGDKGHVTASYFGSFFRDDFSKVSFETFKGQNTIQTMGTAPDNDFHQFSLLGGYTLLDKTKLAGSLSYGRATQNDPFVYDPNMMVTASPRSSANAKVVNTHADIKLTNQDINKLTLTAGMKYDERDNQTPSSIYNFEAISGSKSNRANYPNIPLSNRKVQYELAGDYRLTNQQHVRLAYNRENVQRWCDNYATGGGVYTNSSGTEINTNPYLAGTECVVAVGSKEDKLSATYKLNATENLRLSLGYAYGNRKTNFDTKARTAFIEAVNTVPTANNTAAGLNGGDYLGFHPFFEADRIQQVVKGGVDWQANDKLSLNLNGRYTDDNYNTLYGFQKGNTWSANLDANYSFSDTGSINAYLTKEHRERDLTNLQTLVDLNMGANLSATKLAVPAGSSWTNTLTDDDITFGLGAKKSGLMGDKLQLAGDLTYTLGETGYSTLLNYNAVDTTGRTCSNSLYLTCGALPDVKNRMTQLKLSGNYKVNKNSKVNLGYIYQHLVSNDYYYNALQLGYTPTGLMPTNQQPGSYSVNVVSATYIYTF